MNPTLQTAVYAAYSKAVFIIGNDIDSFIVLDKDEKELVIDKDLVTKKLEELQAQAKATAQAVIDARQSALNKLMALGLTEEEALALGVK